MDVILKRARQNSDRKLCNFVEKCLQGGMSASPVNEIVAVGRTAAQRTVLTVIVILKSCFIRLSEALVLRVKVFFSAKDC